MRRKLANAIARRTITLTQAHHYAQLLRELEGGPPASLPPRPQPLTRNESRERARQVAFDDNPGRDQLKALAALPHAHSRGNVPDVQHDLRVGRLSIPALKRALRALQGQKDERLA